MRAAVLPEIPSMLQVTEIQVDRPGPHEVLVRTVAAGLCHSDLHFMEGKYGHDTPTVPGTRPPGWSRRSAPTSPMSNRATTSSAASRSSVVAVSTASRAAGPL